MSAIPGELRLETEIDDGKRKQLIPPRAMAFEIVVIFAAIAVSVPFLVRLDTHTSGWWTFAVLAAGAAASHTYTVRTAKNSSFHMGTPG